MLKELHEQSDHKDSQKKKARRNSAEKRPVNITLDCHYHSKKTQPAQDSPAPLLDLKANTAKPKGLKLTTQRTQVSQMGQATNIKEQLKKFMKTVTELEAKNKQEAEKESRALENEKANQ